MQQAVLQHFPRAQGTYHFTHRDKDVHFTRECFDHFKRSAAREPLMVPSYDKQSHDHIAEFDRLSLSPDERAWLERTCPYFKPPYLDYLEAYRFKPEQLQFRFEPHPEDKDKYARGDVSARGRIRIDAAGPWEETILWEVPLMACLSEIYFQTADTDWDYEGQDGKRRNISESGTAQRTPFRRGCI